MITCEEFFAELGNYVENRVSPELRRELEQHRHHCRECHALYDSTLKAIGLVAESNSFELPENVSDPMIERVMAKLRSRDK